MTVIRSVIFNIFFYGATGLISVLGFPSMLAARGAACVVRDFWIDLSVVLLRWIAGMSYRVSGRENIPDGPVLVASKHQSAWETIVLQQVFRDPAIVLKKELLSLPFFGAYLRKVGQVPVDRAGGASSLKGLIKAGREAAKMDRPILIFPQGTRVAPGAEAPYQIGVYSLYSAVGRPVVPVALNSGLFWGKSAFWKKSGVVDVEILPPIPPGLKRQEFMALLEERIETATARLEKNAVIK